LKNCKKPAPVSFFVGFWLFGFLKAKLDGFWGFHEFLVIRISTSKYCPHQVNIEEFANANFAGF